MSDVIGALIGAAGIVLVSVVTIALLIQTSKTFR